MATVKLDWNKPSTNGRDFSHRCEIKARKGGGTLVMEVLEWSGMKPRAVSVSAYYRLEDGPRRIPLYDEDQGVRNLDDAKEALAQWYLANAPTLLVTLAG